MSKKFSSRFVLAAAAIGALVQVASHTAEAMRPGTLGAIVASTRRHHHGGYRMNGTSCSGEIADSTVSSARSVLAASADSKEFENAAVFKNFAKEMIQETDSGVVISRFLAVVGVDSNSEDEVLRCLGARDLTPYQKAAEASLQLNAEQAKILVEKFNNEFLKAIAESLK